MANQLNAKRSIGIRWFTNGNPSATILEAVNLWLVAVAGFAPFVLHGDAAIVMPSVHLVRVGVHGHVLPFRSVDATRYGRATRVLVRTTRGIECGEVLAHVEVRESEPENGQRPVGRGGELLRRMGVEDELLQARLLRNREEAIDACTGLIAQRGLSAVLLDVEILFDGESIYFHFLGEVTPELESLTGELAQLYAANIEFQQFAETLATGCGPDCGTANASGGGCGSCATGCALSAHCSTH